MDRDKVMKLRRGEAMILVTGCGGMVGSYINWPDVMKTDIDELDVTNVKQVAQYAKMPLRAIVHLAAETDLERCEKEPQRAFEVNTFGTYNMLNLAREKDITFVFISTAGVFDGKKTTAYTEEDKPNPINVYGATKWCGDLIVKTYPKHYIFRASWMMGGGPKKDKKFVGKIMRKIKSGEKLIYGIVTTMGSPTYAKDLARIIKEALKNKLPYGVYNCANLNYASRFDVAQTIKDIMDYKDVGVMPIDEAGYGVTDKNHFCLRSTNEMLDMGKLIRLGYNLHYWKEALRDYLESEWK